MIMKKEKNNLFYGDNLEILQRYIDDESIDLIYLDPPFKSDKAYNVFFKGENGGKSRAQIKVFEDTWQWDRTAEEAFTEIIEKASSDVKEAIIAFRNFLGEIDMMAYLVMMTIRLIELHRILKPTGSIYLHCDPTASHYLKIIMDRIFGPKNFQNEIIWRYRRWPAKAKRFQRMHDIILFYTKSDNHTFNTLYGYETLAESTLKTFGKKKQIADFSSGHRKPGRLEEETEGPPLSDVWEIGIIAPISKERLGYPTQKPEALLERIIKASSNKGDSVLDPFCGCGTAIVEAQKLDRRWIGIDITHLAINLIKHRLKDMFGVRIKYEVVGEPVTIKAAEELAKQDRYQFQWWALGLVGARPTETEKKKGKDEGIDGALYFFDEPKKPKKIIIQVKSGNVGVKDIRELCNVVDTQKAQIGTFVTLREPTREMKKEAVKASYYSSAGWGKKYPKIQILTIEELLKGKQIEYPPRTNITFKKANKVEEAGENNQLEF